MANYPKPKPRAQGEKIPVAGMTFRPGYPGNIQRLIGFFDGMKPQEQLEGVVAVLVRDPANEYDPNAVEVHVPMLGIDEFIGFLPAKGHADRLAPEIDAGHLFTASVFPRIDPAHPDNPGVDVLVVRRT